MKSILRAQCLVKVESWVPESGRLNLGVPNLVEAESWGPQSGEG